MLFHFVFAIRRSGNNGEGGAGGGGGGTPGPSNSPKEFKTGEEVMASWKNIKYPAKILRWKEVPQLICKIAILLCCLFLKFD